MTAEELPAPPVHKYTLTVEIRANSQEQLADRVRGLDVNWYHHYSEYGVRDEIDSTDGTTSVRLRHTNPEQTEQDYSAQLAEWARARRAARTEAEAVAPAGPTDAGASS